MIGAMRGTGKLFLIRNVRPLDATGRYPGCRRVHGLVCQLSTGLCSGKKGGTASRKYCDKACRKGSYIARNSLTRQGPARLVVHLQTFAAQ